MESKVTKDYKLDAYVIAQQFVKNALKSPSTASFGWQTADECVTGADSRGRYRVRGWVDAQNSYGATMRSTFTVTVRYEGGDKWILTEGPVITLRE